jgi:predicted Zn-dependent protease
MSAGNRPTRRELLRLAGAAAAAPGLATIAAACGSSAPAAESAAARGAHSIRALLRELIDDLERRFPVATALAVRGERGRAGLDAGERGVQRAPVAQVLFQAFDGERWHAEAVASLRADVVASAARRLQSRAPDRRRGRATRQARPRDFVRRGERDPRSAASGEWLALLEALFERAGERATSRITYRGAFLDIDDRDTWYVGGGNDLRQSIVRARAGAVLMSWNGREMIAEEAGRGGTAGLEIAAIETGAIEAATRRALTVPAGPPPAAPDVEVVLAPSVVAALIEQGIAPLFDGRAWLTGASRIADLAGDQIADRLFTLTDDPTVAGGYGSYDFDDEGWLSSPRPLVHRGIVTAPLTDRRSARALGRVRTGHARQGDELPAPHPSNLIVGAGTATTAELIGEVEAGFLVEGGVLARCDPLRGRFLIRVRRIREIARGNLTGRVHGPASIHGQLEALLLAIRGVGSRLTWFTGAGPIAAATAAPHLLTRAEVSG